MNQVRSRTVRTLSILGGLVLVGIFLTWLVLRNQESMQPVFGMQSLWGWVTHIVAILILLGGVALLARGLFARRT